MAKQDIKLTVGTEYDGEGLNKLDQGLKNSAKRAKSATDGIQKVTSALGTMEGKAGQAASKIGGLMQSFAQGGIWGLAIAGITAAFSVVIDKIKEIKEEGEKAASLVGAKMKDAFDKIFAHRNKIQLDIINGSKNDQNQRTVQDRISQIKNQGETDRAEAEAEAKYRAKRQSMIERKATEEELRKFDQDYSKQKELRKVDAEERNASDTVKRLGADNKDYEKRYDAYENLIWQNDLRKNEIERSKNNVKGEAERIDSFEREYRKNAEIYNGFFTSSDEKIQALENLKRLEGQKGEFDQWKKNLETWLQHLEPYIDQEQIKKFKESRESSDETTRWTGQETFFNQIEQVLSNYQKTSQEYAKQQQEIKNNIATNDETVKQLKSNLSSGLYSNRRKAIEDRYSAEETQFTNRKNEEQAKKEKEEIEKKNAEIAKKVQEEEKKHLEIIKKLNDALQAEKDALAKTMIVKSSNGNVDEEKWKMQDYEMEQIKKERQELKERNDSGQITDAEFDLENERLNVKRDKLKAEREMLKKTLREKKTATEEEIRMSELDKQIKDLTKKISSYKEAMSKPIVQEAQNNNFTDWQNIQIQKQRDADRKADKQNANVANSMRRAKQLYQRTHDRNGDVLKWANQRDLDELEQLQQFNTANTMVDKLSESEQRQLDQLQSMNPRLMSDWHKVNLSILEEKAKNVVDLQKKQEALQAAQKDRDDFAELRDIHKMKALDQINTKLNNLGL